MNQPAEIELGEKIGQGARVMVYAVAPGEGKPTVVRVPLQPEHDTVEIFVVLLTSVKSFFISPIICLILRGKEMLFAKVIASAF